MVKIAGWVESNTMTSLQIPLSLNPTAGPQEIPPISHCHRIWVSDHINQPDCNCQRTQDIRTARFTPCFVPYIAIFPAILGALILLTYSLQIFDAYWPRWTKPFVRETKDAPSDLDADEDATHRPLTATFGLLVATSIGLTLQILTIFLPFRQPMVIYSSIAWVRVP